VFIISGDAQASYFSRVSLQFSYLVKGELQ
jgi:hypothetical protein